MDNLGEIMFIGILILFSVGGMVVKALTKSMGNEPSASRPGQQPKADPAQQSRNNAQRRPVQNRAPQGGSFSDMPYFSYETESIDDNFQTARQTASDRRPATDDAPALNELLGNDGFDLRKAVVYQTILQNKYIAEMR